MLTRLCRARCWLTASASALPGANAAGACYPLWRSHQHVRQISFENKRLCPATGFSPSYHSLQRRQCNGPSRLSLLAKLLFWVTHYGWQLYVCSDTFAREAFHHTFSCVRAFMFPATTLPLQPKATFWHKFSTGYGSSKVQATCIRSSMMCTGYTFKQHRILIQSYFCPFGSSIVPEAAQPLVIHDEFVLLC
jgi:hypothetical protein